MLRIVALAAGIALALVLGSSVSYNQAAHAQAGATLSFNLPATPFNLGAPVDIPVQISNASNLAALEYDVNFDATLLDCTSVDWSNFLTQGGREVPVDPNTGSPILLGPDTGTAGSVGLGHFTIPGSGSTGATGNGLLATLHCTTKGVAGTSPLSFSGEILVDPNANTLASSSTAAQLDIRGFADQGLSGEWQYQWVERLWNMGLTAGCGGGNYCTWNTMSRVEMVTFMRAAGGIPTATPAEPTFADLDASHWGYKHVEGMVAAGILDPNNQTQGHSCGTDPGSGKPLFCPGDPASRWVTSAILARVVNIHNQAPSPGAPHFTDVPETHPAYQEIEALWTNGLTAGCNAEGTQFCPDNNLLRAEAAVWNVRAVCVVLLGGTGPYCP